MYTICIPYVYCMYTVCSLIKCQLKTELASKRFPTERCRTQWFVMKKIVQKLVMFIKSSNYQSAVWS